MYKGAENRDSSSAESLPARVKTIDPGVLDALYLFARAMQWRRGDDDAGWELLCALVSSDRATRIAAQALLCDAVG
jgi:hypothetical protein